MKPVEVRRELANALKLDLVGPSETLGTPNEVLTQAPSRWYLTGFLVPLDADHSQKVDEDSNDSVDSAGEGDGADDADTPEPASARQSSMPSSIGLSILVGSETKKLNLKVRWGDYKLRQPSDGHGAHEEWEREQKNKSSRSTSPQKPSILAKPRSKTAAA